MWWAIAALTTVGYGDVYPLSSAGQLLGSLVTIVGIGMVALPSGILASAFSEHQRRNREFLQIAIDDALADGVMDSAELRAIQELGKSVGLSEEKTIDFIRHARKVDTLAHQKGDHT